MPTFTKNLGLTKPDENDYYNQQTEQCDNWDKVDIWSEGIDNKTKGATSEVAGIVKYGTEASTALEGSKLAEILGIEYGGILNNTNAKVAGKGYYDTANKKIYKCTTNTSINYADAGYFIEVSNNDLLGKLQNLYNVRDLNIIDLDSKTLLVSANVSVKNGELRDFSQNYGFCQKYLAFNISNIIPIPKSVHLLGCFCGVRDKTQLGWISGSGSTFSYKSGVLHLYLTNPTSQYDWSDQSVSFSLIAKY